MPIRTILVPTDFSAHAARALDQAIELARPLQAKIHLLHSYYVNISFAPPYPIAIPADYLETIRASARTELETLEKRIAQADLPYESHLSGTEALQAILELAKSLPADLIAMGTHGFTGLKHALLGSVAERTVRLAPCPVLTVKADSGEPRSR